eukprot:scaffold34616_cov159-Skeletonema_dohrnii-CCMP3373.AAC.27
MTHCAYDFIKSGQCRAVMSVAVEKEAEAPAIIGGVDNLTAAAPAMWMFTHKSSYAHAARAAESSWLMPWRLSKSYIRRN